MPFTPAHPAIVMPLAKSKKLSATALIAGSMVPDFEFFFQMREVENIGHHWFGVLLFDIPVALLICYLFHNLLRNLLVANMPAFIQKRFVSTLTFDWNKYVSAKKWPVFNSLLIGIASHFLWDGFTHYDGIFVEWIPVLSAKTGFTGFNIPVYFLLQLIFSLAGLAVMALYIYKMPVKEVDYKPVQSNLYWPLFLFIFAAIMFLRITGWPRYNNFWSLFMAVMGSVCYSWLLVSLLMRKYSIKKIMYSK